MRIQSFLIVLCKSLFLNDFPATAYEKQPSFAPGFLYMIFVEVTFCSPINLEQLVMVLLSVCPYLIS